jgi:hypothetical protein
LERRNLIRATSEELVIFDCVRSFYRQPGGAQTPSRLKVTAVRE